MLLLLSLVAKLFLTKYIIQTKFCLLNNFKEAYRDEALEETFHTVLFPNVNHSFIMDSTFMVATLVHNSHKEPPCFKEVEVYRGLACKEIHIYMEEKGVNKNQVENYANLRLGLS